MCGIFGVIAFGREAFSVDRILDAFHHRGPDSRGSWSLDGVTIGHTRLAIMDLSPQGHQPVVSADGRYVLSFNGELYNFRTLRAELSQNFGCIFKSEGDTEVLLHALQIWGIENTLNRIEGIFAFALWDTREQKLLLARDRFGIKPLVFGWINQQFFFASDLRIVKEIKAGQLAINREGVLSYLRYGYIVAPLTPLESCYKLPAASYVLIDRVTMSALKTYDDLESRGHIKKYWRYRDVQFRSQISFEEAHQGLERILMESVNAQMIADVPIGAFLSGGIDSSVVASLMAEVSEKRIKTFSVGFAESRYNEAPFAAAVAKHIGTEHHELLCTADKAVDLIPRLATIYDEAFGDSSQIPTALVSYLARQFVTVVLSGDGGDELFGGYPRYRWTQRFHRFQRFAPLGIREAFATAIEAIGAQGWQRFFDLFPFLVPRSIPIEAAGFSAMSSARLLRLTSISPLYDFLISCWPRLAVPGTFNSAMLEGRLASILECERDDLYQRMTDWDMSGYLCDDILTKVDRASMWYSLEARVPLLSRDVVEFVWSLPAHIRYAGGSRKKLLRAILDKRVPSQLIDRPKQGFSAPVEVWLKGPLREWAEGLMPKANAIFADYLPEIPLSQIWNSYQQGKAPWVPGVWSALMLSAWYEDWRVS